VSSPSQNLLLDKKKCCIPSFWDLTVETMLAEDRVALNLLYTQAIWEVERGWVLATKDIRNKLSSLQSRGEKKEVCCS